MRPVSALDVAKYILLKQSSPITTMKLQKLVYYSQAWHLAWVGKPLFRETIEAWTNGPVVRELYGAHRGKYSLTHDQLKSGDPDRLSGTQAQVVDDVLASYQHLTASQLSVLTHDEDPWIHARRTVGESARSNAEINVAEMKRYYSALANDEDSVAIDDVDFPAWA